MNAKDVKIFIAQFKNEIAQWEVPLFRGAVINAMDNASVLYHNHLNDDELRYKYPLIQYKRINRKASIVCVGEGTEAIGDFFNGTDFMFQMGDRQERMDIEHMDAKRTLGYGFHVCNTEMVAAQFGQLPGVQSP